MRSIAQLPHSKSSVQVFRGSASFRIDLPFVFSGRQPALGRCPPVGGFRLAKTHCSRVPPMLIGSVYFHHYCHCSYIAKRVCVSNIHLNDIFFLLVWIISGRHCAVKNDVHDHRLRISYCERSADPAVRTLLHCRIAISRCRCRSTERRESNKRCENTYAHHSNSTPHHLCPLHTLHST